MRTIGLLRAGARWVPLALILIAVGSVSVTAWLAQQNTARAACQARYNTQIAAVIAARSHLADESTDALNAMVSAVETARSRQDVADALTAFTGANQRIAAERNAKQFPTAAAVANC